MSQKSNLTGLMLLMLCFCLAGISRTYREGPLPKLVVVVAAIAGALFAFAALVQFVKPKSSRRESPPAIP